MGALSDSIYMYEESCKVGPLVKTGAVKQELSRLAKVTTDLWQVDSDIVDGGR